MIRRLLAAVLAVVVIAAAVVALRRTEPRAVLVAVDAEAFAGLAGRRAAAAGGLWDRLRAMGISAALVHEDTLADLVERAELLNFSPAEIGRWRAAGLISPSSILKGGTLWSKDPRAVVRAVDALAARGFDVTTSTVAGARVVELPPGVDLTHVPAGFDPGVVSALSSAGIVPIAASTAPFATAAGRILWIKTLSVDAQVGEVFRAALGRPFRLLVFRPRVDLGLDQNAALLRDGLRALRAAGVPSTLPAMVVEPPQSDAERRLRLGFVWMIGLAGPLFAARAALEASRRVRSYVCRFKMEIASPVPQVAAGLAAAWIAATLAGLAAVGLAPVGWRDGAERGWTLWTWCAPLIVGAGALFGSERGRGWAAPLRRRDLAAAGLLLLAGVLLLAPREALRASWIWEWFDGLSGGLVWWWPWRWREALVGAPCLAGALSLIEARDLAETHGAHASAAATDPRGWLLVGILGPSGLVAALGGGGAPLNDAIVHGAAAIVVGGLIGAAAAAAKAGVSRWALRPKRK